MGRFLVFLIIFFLVSCGEKNESKAILYVSNHSTDNFEKAFFKVYVNGDIVFRDTLQNERLSFHWTEKEILVPKERFELKAIVSGEDYRLERDTIIGYDDSLQVFVRFNFSPFYKRYNNPEIYKYIDGGVNDFQSFADSLYANDILDNANEYLNDTVPNASSLEIFVK
jgi:hypothetical protein